ncbi:hypothetical protein IT407_04935 [Candidatus Uhrbacteria bacterium]|nr:hypothetical protein [Candidatus Uhrbacteria bacterium]
MQMKCSEYRQKLESIKSDVEYAKRLIEDFKKTGVEEEESILWVIQNIENSASWFREKLTTSSEQEAQEIMGDTHFIGTKIAEKIFGGSKPFEPRIPFSRAELMEAKMEGKILLYRPSYTMRGPPMTIEGMITNIQFNDPSVNADFFNGNHVFNLTEMLNMARRGSINPSGIEKSSWNLLEFHESGTREEAVKKGAIPSAAEVFYDLLSAKKLTEMLLEQNQKIVWVSVPRTTMRLAKDGSGVLALVTAPRADEERYSYYTCESREVD